MLIVVRNPMYRLIALAVSVAIFLILYFAVIKPNNDKANSTVQQSLQQVSKATHQRGSNVPVGVQNLIQCLAAAGTNTAQIEACKAKFKP